MRADFKRVMGWRHPTHYDENDNFPGCQFLIAPRYQIGQLRANAGNKTKMTNHDSSVPSF
jgi:hypothetical protein